MDAKSHEDVESCREEDAAESKDELAELRQSLGKGWLFALFPPLWSAFVLGVAAEGTSETESTPLLHRGPCDVGLFLMRSGGCVDSSTSCTRASGPNAESPWVPFRCLRNGSGQSRGVPT